MTKARQTGMAVDNLYLLPDDDISKDWEEREDCRHCGFSVYDHEGNIVDFETVCQISYTGAITVRMSDDNDFVSAIDEFLLGKLSGNVC